MPSTAQKIVQKQNELLEAMREIRTMCRGTLSVQTYPERSQRNDGKGAVGPYCLWQGTVCGKRFGKRVSGAKARRIEEAIAKRHAFEALCEEYVELGCRLEALELEAGASEGALKKGLKSRSNKASK